MTNDLISRRKSLEIFDDASTLDYNAQAYKNKIKNLPSEYSESVNFVHALACTSELSKYHKCSCAECAYGQPDHSCTLAEDMDIYASARKLLRKLEHR